MPVLTKTIARNTRSLVLTPMETSQMIMQISSGAGQLCYYCTSVILEFYAAFVFVSFSGNLRPGWITEKIDSTLKCKDHSIQRRGSVRVFPNEREMKQLYLESSEKDDPLQDCQTLRDFNATCSPCRTFPPSLSLALP